jgi:hypothetical protein
VWEIGEEKSQINKGFYSTFYILHSIFYILSSDLQTRQLESLAADAGHHIRAPRRGFFLGLAFNRRGDDAG